jgi:L-lactate dehydrogenase
LLAVASLETRGDSMKISMIGAGNVGSVTVFALLQKGFANELVIVDLNRDLAEGEAMDIMHATPFYRRTSVIAGDYKDIKDSDIVIISAGAAQKDGESRLQLSEKNARIMKSITEEIVKYAPQSIILVLTNPVDVMTAVVQKISGFEKARVIGSGTVLDTMRLRSLISTNCSISASNAHIYIIGEHGDSEVPVWSGAKMGGIPISDYSKDCSEPYMCSQCLGGLFEQTQNAAYEIIKKKGATNYAIAASTAHIVESVINDEKRILTVSSPHKDIYIGYPAIIGKNGIERTIPLKLSDAEQMLFDKSVGIIKEQTEKIFMVLGLEE